MFCKSSNKKHKWLLQAQQTECHNWALPLSTGQYWGRWVPRDLWCSLEIRGPQISGAPCPKPWPQSLYPSPCPDTLLLKPWQESTLHTKTRSYYRDLCFLRGHGNHIPDFEFRGHGRLFTSRWKVYTIKKDAMSFSADVDTCSPIADGWEMCFESRWCEVEGQEEDAHIIFNLLNQYTCIAEVSWSRI